MHDLMDTAAVAAFTGLKRETVRYYNKRRMMPEPDQYFGRSPVWSRDRITEWDAARRAKRYDNSPSKTDS